MPDCLSKALCQLEQHNQHWNYSSWRAPLGGYWSSYKNSEHHSPIRTAHQLKTMKRMNWAIKTDYSSPELCFFTSISHTFIQTLSQRNFIQLRIAIIFKIAACLCPIVWKCLRTKTAAFWRQRFVTAMQLCRIDTNLIYLWNRSIGRRWMRRMMVSR